jgi:threonine dehydrogenase-like Zn-dependent dehydrogenase
MEMRDIPKPTLKAGQYLVQVKANGICGSDFEGYMGKTGRRIPPMIMGHEVSGIIEEVPAGGKIRKGERVVVFPKPFCGVCEFCKKGMVNAAWASWTSMAAVWPNTSSGREVFDSLRPIALLQ